MNFFFFFYTNSRHELSTNSRHEFLFHHEFKTSAPDSPTPARPRSAQSDASHLQDGTPDTSRTSSRGGRGVLMSSAARAYVRQPASLRAAAILVLLHKAIDSNPPPAVTLAAGVWMMNGSRSMERPCCACRFFFRRGVRGRRLRRRAAGCARRWRGGRRRR